MLEKIRSNMKELQLDGLWITDPHSINFVIGREYHVGERFIGLYIDMENKPILVLNKLFSYEGNECDLVEVYDHQDVYTIISNITSGSKIGLDKNMAAQYVLSLIESKPQVQFVNGSDCIDLIRAIKRKEQIEKMKKASELNDKVMSEVRDFIRVGMTELEIEKKIDELFEANGVVRSFDTIVAFGDHGVDPHAVPSNRVLKENESIIIDMGCILDGYCSDMTRTYFIGDSSDLSIYNIVLRANQDAIKAIKPGVTFSDLDRVAREIITEAGYGEYFTHRLGHGIGQEVHEPYDVSQSNHQEVKPGMCFSIEPGIYKPGVDAVRIEDLVYVNEEGYGVRLNNLDKENPII